MDLVNDLCPSYSNFVIEYIENEANIQLEAS